MANVPFPSIFIPGFPDVSSAINQNFAQLKIANTDIVSDSVIASNLSSVIMDTDSRCLYSAGWTPEIASGSAPAGYLGGYNNKYHNTLAVGSYVQFSGVTGALNVVCITGPDCGQISVVIDGGSPITVDLYNLTYAVKTVYQSGPRQNQQHKIVLTLLNTKNGASSGKNFNFVALTDGTQLTDANILVGALNDISINSVSANKILANTIMFNVGLNNGNGTFSVDAQGNLIATSATISGDITGGTINIGAGNFTVDNTGFVTIGNGNSLLIAGAENFYDNVNLRNAFSLATGNNELHFTTFFAGTFRWLGAALQQLMALDSSGNLTVDGELKLPNATTTTTAPSAGGAGALPATPKGYFTISIAGSDQKVAYY